MERVARQVDAFFAPTGLAVTAVEVGDPALDAGALLGVEPGLGGHQSAAGRGAGDLGVEQRVCGRAGDDEGPVRTGGRCDADELGLERGALEAEIESGRRGRACVAAGGRTAGPEDLRCDGCELGPAGVARAVRAGRALARRAVCGTARGLVALTAAARWAAGREHESEERKRREGTKLARGHGERGSSVSRCRMAGGGDCIRKGRWGS